jgi:transcription initiation factor TFIID subunit 7
VDVENIDCDQQPLLSAKPSRPAPLVAPGTARRSTRPRPPVGTYANLRRRSISPDGGSFKRSNRLSSKPQKRKYDSSLVPGPKLKLRLGERSGVGTSFMGPWDRDLDSDDDDLAFEEQFILRMPEGEDCEWLRRMVASRNVGQDIWFKFKGEHNFPNAPSAM